MGRARLWIPGPLAEDQLLELDGEELEHARALRLRVGDGCEGLDGRGHRQELEVVALEKRALRVRATAAAMQEPAPGEERAALPWIELAIAWPRKNRAEPMLGALVQLGVARVTPLATRFRGPEPPPERLPSRWERLVVEALKQSGRAWRPELAGAEEPAALLERVAPGAVAWLDPGAGLPLDTWLRSLAPGSGGALGTRERPLVLAVGPEGGWDEAERAAFLDAGASGVRLGPHVLRIETAATAAAAVAATVLGGPPRTD